MGDALPTASQALLEELQRREEWLRPFRLAAEKVLVPDPNGKVKRYVAMCLLLREMGMPFDYRTSGPARQALIALGARPTFLTGRPIYRGIRLAQLTEAEADQLCEDFRKGTRGTRSWSDLALQGPRQLSVAKQKESK